MSAQLFRPGNPIADMLHLAVATLTGLDDAISQATGDPGARPFGTKPVESTFGVGGNVLPTTTVPVAPTSPPAQPLALAARVAPSLEMDAAEHDATRPVVDADPPKARPAEGRRPRAPMRRRKPMRQNRSRPGGCPEAGPEGKRGPARCRCGHRAPRDDDNATERRPSAGKRACTARRGTTGTSRPERWPGRRRAPRRRRPRPPDPGTGSSTVRTPRALVGSPIRHPPRPDAGAPIRASEAGPGPGFGTGRRG